MASKIRYNNIQYDILNAIQIRDKEYLFMSNPNDVSDLKYVEKTNINGQEKYSLPPSNLSIENNPNADLKMLQVNAVVSHIIDILKQNIKSGVLKNSLDIKKQLLYIERLIYNDLAVQGVINDNDNLDRENYQVVVDSLNHYFDSQFLLNDVDTQQSTDENNTNRQITTPDGLNYEWLYSLSSAELKEIANQQHTSEELIYILDALDKRLDTERSIENYTSGFTKQYRKDNKAAFADILLLALITGSFWLLMLISLF